ncbi:hypothetical protein GOBAR_AA12934 [Gossypium barbadense]|uniref:Uncharacterized protein n=1 Tax=Gossypium barbadense TaxID=3634 RepID=A0A2P5XWL4_GOSBA|nr:hypothetical protein GOBAR_AA12934 [Gossypium barbadense]
MMNEFLELEFWRIIDVRVEEDTPVALELWRTFPSGVFSSYARMSFGALSDCDKIRNSLRGALVYTIMLQGRADLRSLLPCPCLQVHACVKLTGLPMVLKHGRVARLCYFGSFAHGHVARPWLLIASRVGEEILALFSQGLRHSRVASRGMCTAYDSPVYLAVWF